MKINNEKNKILILCAGITKTNKKNGFLYFILRQRRPIFFETTFKVNCFCQLSKFLEENKSIFNENINNKLEGTNYFLVGGENEESKERGIIRLFKYDENSNEITKENYIKNDFKEPVSCIIQARKNGNILISCKDGNFYVFERTEIKGIKL